MHGDAIQGIQGEAGTGKTAALSFVREVAESKGWRVLGMAISSSAAEELGRSSGIESSTVASFFAKQDSQVRIVRGEIDALTSTLESQAAQKLAPGTMVEFRRLAIAGADGAGDTQAYSFDHKRGVVFRMNNGLMGATGIRLLDFSQEAKDRAADRSVASTTLAEAVGARAASAGGRIAEWVGLRLADFQKIDGAEGVAARTSLVEKGGNEQQQLARRLGLKRAELRNLQKYGDLSGRRTLLVMDETSLTGAADLATMTTVARSISARAVLQGDTKQHGSPAAGRAFGQAQSFGMNTSVLRETMRFRDATEQVKAAHEHMQRGKFGEAYKSLDAKVVDRHDLASAVGRRFAELVKELGDEKIEPGVVGVAALTNVDRKAANAAIHLELQKQGLIGAQSFEKEHLERPKLTRAEHHFASALQANRVTHLSFARGQPQLGLPRGAVVQVAGFDLDRNRVSVRTDGGRIVQLDLSKHAGFAAMAMEKRSFAVGDRIEAREVIRTNGQKRSRIGNGARGKISEISETGVVVKLDDGRNFALSNSQVRSIDHSYARTTFKEQGATTQHEVIMVSETGAKIFNREAAYVAATRAKKNTEIITSDRERLIQNVGTDVSKTTALSAPEMSDLVKQARAQQADRAQTTQRSAKERTPQKVQELSRD